MAFPPAALMADSRLNAAARLLAVSLWWPLDPKARTGRNWESPRGRRERVGLSRSTYYEAIAALVKFGWARQEGRVVVVSEDPDSLATESEGSDTSSGDPDGARDEQQSEDPDANSPRIRTVKSEDPDTLREEGSRGDLKREQPLPLRPTTAQTGTRRRAAMNAMTWTRRLYEWAGDRARRRMAVDASRGLPVSPSLALAHLKRNDTVETLRERLLSLLHDTT